jgi:hypothetical protein
MFNLAWKQLRRLRSPIVNSPDNPELRMAPNEKPRPRLLSTAASSPVSLAPPELAPQRRRSVFVTLWLVFVAAAIAGAIAAGADHFFGHEDSAKSPPISVLKPIRQALPTPPKPPLDVPESALHVTAIVLGAPPLAIVNGKQLSEGDWLEVRMDAGVAALHVVKIEDGLVRFAYGGRVIDARFDQMAQKKAP